jgi:hypothetical protein
MVIAMLLVFFTGLAAGRAMARGSELRRLGRAELRDRQAKIR